MNYLYTEQGNKKRLFVKFIRYKNKQQSLK